MSIPHTKLLIQFIGFQQKSQGTDSLITTAEVFNLELLDEKAGNRRQLDGDRRIEQLAFLKDQLPTYISSRVVMTNQHIAAMALG